MRWLPSRPVAFTGAVLSPVVPVLEEKTYDFKVLNMVIICQTEAENKYDFHS